LDSPYNMIWTEILCLEIELKASDTSILLQFDLNVKCLETAKYFIQVRYPNILNLVKAEFCYQG
jgi:hypothetical protein